MRVLVVERERELAALVTTTLEDEGHQTSLVVDRDHALETVAADPTYDVVVSRGFGPLATGVTCLLYTSDAADDMQCVDLGGRRIIKKKFFSSRRRHTR